MDVDYSAGKLTLEVTTADGSNQAVTDTRALSGKPRAPPAVGLRSRRVRRSNMEKLSSSQPNKPGCRRP